MGTYLLISDAAKAVKVESHVLRYWEEELRLPIKRNELGHRYYTQEDVERFRQIKAMKERGLQLKAIKMILKDGKLDVLPQEDFTDRTIGAETEQTMAIDVVSVRDADAIEEEYPSVVRQKSVEPAQQRPSGLSAESREDKARRLQWLLQQLIRETLRENNEELCQNIKEGIIKELDYQFRNQEEREEERDRQARERSEEYYRKMDELLCKKSRRRSEKPEKKAAVAAERTTPTKAAAGKKKRHFIF
ncbi:MAG: MerR family transcriptional regulator [Lachnospiraceae bacterium]|nr:MerR family transcriptional regulator [Lachnospiraceae bacterium]